MTDEFRSGFGSPPPSGSLSGDGTTSPPVPPGPETVENPEDSERAKRVAEIKKLAQKIGFFESDQAKNIRGMISEAYQANDRAAIITLRGLCQEQIQKDFDAQGPLRNGVDMGWLLWEAAMLLENQDKEAYGYTVEDILGEHGLVQSGEYTDDEKRQMEDLLSE